MIKMDNGQRDNVDSGDDDDYNKWTDKEPEEVDR